MSPEKDLYTQTYLSENGARAVLEGKAVMIADEPIYIFSGGSPSEVYINVKEVPMHPNQVTIIEGILGDKITLFIGKPDIIAGVSTGGIGWAWGVAGSLNLPYLTANKDVKDHGTRKQQTTEIKPESTVLLIEDVINSGESSLKTGQGLRDNGAVTDTILAVVDYKLPSAHRRAKEQGFKLEAVTDIPTIIKIAEEEEYLKGDKLQKLKNWYEKQLSLNP